MTSMAIPPAADGGPRKEQQGLLVDPAGAIALVQSIRAWKTLDPTSDDDWLAMMRHVDVIENGLAAVLERNGIDIGSDVRTDTA